MADGTLLFYGGILLSALSLVLGLIGAAMLNVRRKRLKETLDQEYRAPDSEKLQKH